MKTNTKTWGARLGLFAQTWIQAALLIGFWWVCDRGVRAAGVPLPAGVVGMLLLIALLGLHVLPARWFARGAGGLLNHMLLFFVPACITLRDHPELLGATGLKLLAVIVVGIVSVMVGTALVVELHFRTRSRHAR
jgi:holin-like protein